MSIKVASIGTVEERLTRLEQAVNFSEVLLGLPMAMGEDLAAAGGRIEIPTGTLPGTSFAFVGTPVLVQPFLNGVALYSQATPGIGEYSMSGGTLTTGDTVVTGDRLWALVWY